VCSSDLLIEDVLAYGQPEKPATVRSILTRPLPLLQLDVQYEYWVRPGDADWEPITITVRVSTSNDQLTGAEILWKLHAVCGPQMQKYDSHFFEGLVLEAQPGGNDTPLYSLRLGS
jgi:hypothetical protein